ncbi:hypothetical protein OIU79_010277 [Salix purpurea]|uniref:Uncharacterized protein n=1 Tax=Salix purpurea TaxID=77065 RepID=A0A9Q0QF84_SALPP|nr:hypothetical protein OIU79_010277 [Salix purpurea]
MGYPSGILPAFTCSPIPTLLFHAALEAPLPTIRDIENVHQLRGEKEEKKDNYRNPKTYCTPKKHTSSPTVQTPNLYLLRMWHDPDVNLVLFLFSVIPPTASYNAPVVPTGLRYLFHDLATGHLPRTCFDYK